jgi:hypothetical protein
MPEESRPSYRPLTFMNGSLLIFKYRRHGADYELALALLWV